MRNQLIEMEEAFVRIKNKGSDSVDAIKRMAGIFCPNDSDINKQLVELDDSNEKFKKDCEIEYYKKRTEYEKILELMAIGSVS